MLFFRLYYNFFLRIFQGGEGKQGEELHTMDLIQILQKPTERILLTLMALGLGSGSQTQQPKANHSLESVSVILGQLLK